MCIGPILCLVALSCKYCYKIQSRVTNRRHNEDPISLLSQPEKAKGTDPPESSCFLSTSTLFKGESPSVTYQRLKPREGKSVLCQVGPLTMSG